MSDLRTLTVLRKLIVDTVNADPHLPFGHLDDEVAERVAAAILARLDAHHPLPGIDAEHDDVTYWEGLDDWHLDNTVAVDAWNLAAGLHVQTRRREAETARRAAEIAEQAQPVAAIVAAAVRDYQDRDAPTFTLAQNIGAFLADEQSWGGPPPTVPVDVLDAALAAVPGAAYVDADTVGAS